MGAELDCQAKVRGVLDKGHALLETNEVIFRGKQRCVVKLDGVRATAFVKGEWLLLGELALKLGEAAPAWLQKIKNPKSVLDKLGLKPDGLVWLVRDFDAQLTKDLLAKGLSVFEGVPKKPAPLIFYKLKTPKDLPAVAKLSTLLTPQGALWLIRPKGKDAAVTEQQTMVAGRSAGLVDVKVVGFSETHSALQFVIPLAERK